MRPFAALRDIRTDLTAGLTVALVGLPQCLAYAMMTGLPPAYGIVTAAVPGLIAAVAGKSAQVVTGPTNTTSLLILSALSPFLGDNGLLEPAGLPMLATLTLLAGAVRLLVAFSGGAALIRFLPESVLVGFTAGAGVLIAVMQLDEALGLPPVRARGLLAELGVLHGYFASGTFPDFPAVAVTILVVAGVALGRRWLPRLPIALILVAGVTLLAWAFRWDATVGLPLVGDRAAMPAGWPPTALPDLSPDLLRRLLVPAAAITLLGTLELAVTARARGARPDMKREILSQGWANLGGAFAGAFPASASLTRSALLWLEGARSRWAPGVAAAAMFPILLFAAPSVGYIPQASLAGVLLLIAYRMLDREAMARMWHAAPATRLLLVATLGSTLTLPLEWAILFGAGLGLVIHLARTSSPRLRLLKPDGERLVPIPRGESAKVVVVEVSGDLHYAAVQPFLENLRRMLPGGVEAVVVDLTHAHEIRFTALVGLEALSAELARAGARLHLAGIPPDVQRLMERTGSRLPATPAEDEPLLSVRKSLRSIAQEQNASR